ncbi:MAG: ATP-binding protein [Desulfarculus sp.]|nr:ATP-binding protein [Desulfarculus sp.]
MDACPTVLTGETMRLITPGAPEYLSLVLDFCEHAARLAGFGDHGARRCRLIAEELFHRVARECREAGRRDPCQLEATLTADGLNLCLTTDHLSWDPENEPAYSLAEVLEGAEPAGLGLHLVKRYAKAITLTRRGPSRELCLSLPRESDDQGVHPWHRLVPSLAPGVSLKPVEKDGRLVYKLEHAARGKTYLARALAHQVLTLVDGRQTFGQIMAQTMKVMPETGRHKLEDLFQVLMDRGVVTVRSLERPEAEIEVRQMLEPRTLQALSAYQKVAKEGEPPQG